MSESPQTFGRYRVLRELGRGGFGAVYLAEDPSLDNRKVALKVLFAQLVADPETLGLFRKEAGTMARLEHPHIVPIYEAGEVEGRRYIAMRYVPGRTLSDLLREEGPQSPERVAAWLEQAASALDHAHRQGVLHRDVKPQNLLLDSEGRAMLTDFGLAKAVSVSGGSVSAQQQEAMCGTARYMAPEQARGKPVVQSDVYGLGVLAYELLTGQVPFDGEDAFSIAFLHVSEPPRPPRELRPDLAETVELVVLRALEKQPADRFVSAGEMARAFRLALAPRVAAARPPVPAAVQPQAPAPGQSLRRTPSGLVIATRENLAGLLAMREPPARVWWEKAELELCLVPAGEFLMGSLKSEKEASDDERPQRVVYLDAFYLGRTPVTQAQYARFVQEAGHPPPFVDQEWALPCNWDRIRRTPPAGKAEHPVVLVSWDDAVAWCRWAGLRLPTEAEWEKAARGTDGRMHPWGSEWDAKRCNTSEGNKGGTTPVGAYSSAGDSPCGCADMAGNVWEWCADWYDGEYYAKAPSRNPPGPASGQSRVLRGGSWFDVRFFARSACRDHYVPGYRCNRSGFRVVVAPALPS